MEWVTSLLNQRTKFEKKVLENWNHAQELIEDKVWQNLKVFFEVKGIRPNIVDFMAYVEKWTPNATREGMSYFLDFFRSSTLGMGLRVAKLTDTQIEVVLPTRPKNIDEFGQILDSAIITTGIEASKILWLRHAPVGEFLFEIQKIHYEKIAEKMNSLLRIRYELNHEHREFTLNQLRDHSIASTEAEINVYDQNEARVAEFKIQLKISNIPQLTSRQTEIM